jgi:hypothetical protein
MTTEQDIIDIVDEIVDDIDPVRIETEASRLWPDARGGWAQDQLIDRVVNELKARLT